MQSQDYFGMEMLWKLEKNNVNAKSDLLVLLVHWYLMKNGFRNVGVGDDKTLDESAELSELLPEGWNANAASYALRYTINNELYNLHGTLANGTMIFNLLHAKSLQVSNVVFNLDEIVHTIRGSKLLNLVDKVDEQITRLERELLKPMHTAPVKTGTQTQTETIVGRQPHICTSAINRHHLISDVGMADRDPLGSLGGGMLMDPLRPRMPSAGFPLPRPRIDPMGPLGPNNRFNQFPNPDHLPPPGYDDMFM